MRNIDEIVEAHDRYVATILGDMPSAFPKRDLEVLKAACDVLCWVLEHDHNTTFANNLKTLKDFQEAKGFHLSRHDN